MKEDKTPRQKYILSEEDKCPFCDSVSWSRDTMVSSPSKKRRETCGENVTIY